MALRRLARSTGRVLRRVTANDRFQFFRPPDYPRQRITAKKLLNLYLARYHYRRGDVKLFSYPHILTIEPTNVCNLRCPYCFTGAGEVGREVSMMPMELYERILNELGDYLFYLELCNWGEPLLNKNLPEMLSAASSKGISTGISTNFSVPFDATKAEALVASGLTRLGVSLDGARQESYEKYRVRGNLERILQNVRLVNEAKTKLSSETPIVIWEFHVFEWNKDDIPLATSMAEELQMQFALSKGYVEGPDWDPDAKYPFSLDLFPPGVAPSRCEFPWFHAVINNDGGVPACCGAFYKEHDYGSIAGGTFKDVWNNEAFQNARRLFRSRQGGAENLICYDCPVTIVWDDYKRHRAAGRSEASFTPPFTTNNEAYNYFLQKKPGQPAGSPNDAINLRPVERPERIPDSLSS